MEPSTSRSARVAVEVLLPYAVEKARAFEGDISLSGSNTYLRRVAAANLFRIPRCLKAIFLLADGGMSLEANTICRTLVDLTIRSCWMGTDDDRAAQVWNGFVVAQQRGISRFGAFTGMMAPLSEAEKRVLNSIQVPPHLAACAEAAVDSRDLPARKIACALYDLLYDSLSTASHGDLRDAISIVQWNMEAHLVDEALATSIRTAVPLLCMTSLQLGFRSEVEAFLNARGLETPFSPLRP